MGGNTYCSIPGCRSNRKKAKTEGRNISLFTPPSNVELLEKWQKAIPFPNFVLTKKDKICHLHFKEDEIERFYVTHLPNGEIHKIERGKIAIKFGAIPSIFNDVDEQEQKRKIAKDNTTSKEQIGEDIMEINHTEENPMNETTNIDFSVEDNTNTLTDVSETYQVTHQTVSTFEELLNNITSVLIPVDLWGITVTKDFIIFSRWTKEFLCVKKVIVDSDLKVRIFIHEKEINVADSERVSSVDDLISPLNATEYTKICLGATEKSMTECSIILKTCHEAGRKKSWCSNCLNMKKSLKNKRTKHTLLGFQTLQNRLKIVKQKNQRLKQKTQRMRQEIVECRKRISAAKSEVVDEAINALPRSQQEAVRACFNAAKLKNIKNSRYTLQWIYECLLIRIKSGKTYNHLRKNKILALPAPQTLRRYIEKVKGVYGFQPSIFSSLQKKSLNMNVKDRRGVLLLDEMKISSKVNLNRKTFKVEGFTDLGDATPDNQKNEKGDHALVLMFQPFRGQWVQSLACFLSKNAASGSVLHHLVLECIILLEKAGFFVDGVTADGAAWNRKMWAKFGVGKNKSSCTHVCDSERRLWFFSDFPHLIKNVRNTITDKRRLMTPDGLVTTEFWDEVVAADNPRNYSLKRCPKLRPDHIRPKFYQKMNVAMAFQFFSHDVASAMRCLRPQNDKLKDSQGCENFIERMHKLIKAMNAKKPEEGLRANSSSMEALTTFLSYLEDWETLAKSQNINFLSESTATGLKVTITSTLELFKFLNEKQGYKYLLTSRLSQDALERFFSMMRNACGCNDHPDATTFLQVFRLLGMYSLIKPPRGSNVTGSEMVRSLLDFNDLTPADNAHQEFNDRLELLLTTGSKSMTVANLEDHSYFQQNSPDCAVGYLAGFVAFRGQKMSKCDICKRKLLFSEEDKENVSMTFYNLIDIKTYGYLKKPSAELLALIAIVEKSIMKVLSAQKLQVDTLSEIMNDLEQVSNFPPVGCEQHLHTFTKALLHYYLIIRMLFICRQENLIDNMNADKSRELKKLSKL